jgi:hypothetical protein
MTTLHEAASLSTDAGGTTSRLAGITIDCAHPARLAAFWSAILGITRPRETSGVTSK